MSKRDTEHYWSAGIGFVFGGITGMVVGGVIICHLILNGFFS